MPHVYTTFAHMRQDFKYSYPGDMYVIKPKEEENNSWICVRAFGSLENTISYMREAHAQYFIPLDWKVWETRTGEKREGYRPVVTNFIFLRIGEEVKETLNMVTSCPYPVSVMRTPGTYQTAFISKREMYEFQTMCNPEYTKIYMEREQAEMKSGDEVVIKSGNFKGFTGKLVRVKKKYYLVKTAGELAILLQVPRWQCEKMAAKKET